MVDADRSTDPWRPSVIGYLVKTLGTDKRYVVILSHICLVKTAYIVWCNRLAWSQLQNCLTELKLVFMSKVCTAAATAPAYKRAGDATQLMQPNAATFLRVMRLMVVVVVTPSIEYIPYISSPNRFICDPYRYLI